MGYRKVPRFQISLVYEPILSSGCLWKLPHPGHCCNVMLQHQRSVDYVIIVSLAYYNYPKCDTRYYSLYQRINVYQHSLATALKALSCFKISCLNSGASVPSLWRLQRRWTVHLNTVVWKAGTVLLQLYHKRSLTCFCDGLNIDSKELIGRVRQATKDVVKSEV